VAPPALQAGGASHPPRHAGRLLRLADRIGEDILRHRRRTPRGETAWLGPTGYGTPESPFRIVRLPPHLYDGTTGVALFLAALGVVSGEASYRSHALEAIQPLRRLLAEVHRDPARHARLQLSVGGFIGIGSLLYGLLVVGELLGEPELLEEAEKVTDLLSDQQIARDDRYRVQKGCAGAVLALLALHRRRPGDGALLDRALGCARHLISGRVSDRGLPRAWPLAPGRRPTAGYSYGAAGICYALLRLHAVTGDPEVLHAAEEGLAFQRSLYDARNATWIDTRFGEARCSAGWCHGSAGIVLSRVAALDRVDGAEVRQEISGGLEELARYAEPAQFARAPMDDLCCGNAGRIEVLNHAAGRLGCDEHADAAFSLAELVADRCETTGYAFTSARGRQVFDPALFQGVAGIGYTMLRLAAPDRLPCVLLLE
jgi:lantibiotic modifying enzyme